MSEDVTKADLDALETRLLERVERVETTLLKEFRKWAISSNRDSNQPMHW
jgi:hypothetical protein